MVKNRRFGAAGAALMVSAALLSTASIAHTDPPKPAGTNCFAITQWQGRSSPSPNVIYLKVNMHDVYRVDLSGGSRMLQAPDVHLVSRVHGPNTICSAIDLQLEVSDNTGFSGNVGAGIRGGFGDVGGGVSEPLIASNLTKLTPDQVAAIPAKDRPN
jgi:hypothetical protein